MKRRIRLMEYLTLLVLGLLVILAMVWPELSTFSARNTSIEISAIIHESDAIAGQTPAWAWNRPSMT